MNANDGTKTPEGSTDMLELDALRLPQDFTVSLGVKRMLVQVPMTKPRKGWFVRTRPGDEWRVKVATIELRDVGEEYIVNPRLAADLPDDVVHKVLVTGINRHGTTFLWPLRIPSSSRRDLWAESATAACTWAETNWVRVTANMPAGAYEVAIATARWPEPEWPEQDFASLFRLATKDRVIDSIDHPVIQKLKGAV